MGCAESKQESKSQPLLLSTYRDDNDDLYTPMLHEMGQPQPQPQTGAGSGAGHLSSQYERLLLELLPFKDSRQFHE